MISLRDGAIEQQKKMPTKIIEFSTYLINFMDNHPSYLGKMHSHPEIDFYFSWGGQWQVKIFFSLMTAHTHIACRENIVLFHQGFVYFGKSWWVI